MHRLYCIGSELIVWRCTLCRLLCCCCPDKFLKIICITTESIMLLAINHYSYQKYELSWINSENR